MIKHIFAGVGLGLLVGSIIGLSIAEITGIILGALTSMLAAFFGLRANREGETGNQVVIGAFGFACFFGIIFGIYSRTHDLLAPGMKEDFNSYLEIGFDSTETKELIKIIHFGIVPAESVESSSDLITTKTKKSALYSSEMSKTDLCDKIDPSSSCTDLETLLYSFAQFSDMVEELKILIPDPQIRGLVLHSFCRTLCYE